jgi:hypothetical protein
MGSRGNPSIIWSGKGRRPCGKFAPNSIKKSTFLVAYVLKLPRSRLLARVVESLFRGIISG